MIPETVYAQVRQLFPDIPPLHPAMIVACQSIMAERERCALIAKNHQESSGFDNGTLRHIISGDAP